VFGLTPNPAILSETIHHHVTWYLLTVPKMAEILNSVFHVNDFTICAQNVEKGFDIYKRVKQVVEQGGFNLRKWRTNVLPLQQRINMAEGRESETRELKLLGILWLISFSSILRKLWIL